MNVKNKGQKVECDCCDWKGFEIELEHKKHNNKNFALCPVCADQSISYMGYDFESED